MALRDLQLIDTDVYSSISWMLENDVEELGFTFEAETPGDFGEIVVKELKPNGSLIAVTNANKNEFVELKARHIMVGQRQLQLDALRDGFATVLPLSELTAFDTSELELMLCGVPSLDTSDWIAHTVYKAGYSRDHQTIQHYWTIIGAWCDFPNETTDFPINTTDFPAKTADFFLKRLILC